MDRTSQKSFRLLKKIKDPKFEIDRLEFYSLSLFMGLKDFQILIIDTEINQCVLLEDYVFDTELEDEVKFDVIKYIFDDHHLLMANFWKCINLIIKSRVFSFIPKELFDEESISGYLRVHNTLDISREEVMLTYHKNLDMVNVFTVPKKLVDLTERIYPGKKVRFIHQSSSLIEGVVDKNQSQHKDIVIYIDRFGMHLMVVEDKHLLFYNQYVIRKFHDYIKFIKIAAGELKFDLHHDPINLYGYLGRNTPHFKELKKTISQLNLGARPNNLNFSYVFDEILDHQYFDLFSTETFR